MSETDTFAVSNLLAEITGGKGIVKPRKEAKERRINEYRRQIEAGAKEIQYIPYDPWECRD